MCRPTEEAPMDQPAPDLAARPPPAPRVNLTWAAFLVMTFVIVGLAGLFASFAVPLPLQRALARDAALDQALAAAHGPDPAATLAALRPQLAESADAILPQGGDFDGRVAAERAAMRGRLQAESDEVALRIRWLLCVVTAMAAAFGVAILHIGRRG
jgi:hypothetical protein